MQVIKSSDAFQQNILVSEQDFKLLQKYKWYIDDSGYANGVIDNNLVQMHVFIMSFIEDKIVKGKEIEHIDCDKLNNCRNNLRVRSTVENSAHKLSTFNDSVKYKHIHFISKNTKYQYYVRFKTNNIHKVAYYTSELHAAWQLNLWIDKYGSESYQKNDIEEPEGFVEYIRPENSSKVTYIKENKKDKSYYVDMDKVLSYDIKYMKQNSRYKKRYYGIYTGNEYEIFKTYNEAIEYVEYMLFEDFEKKKQKIINGTINRENGIAYILTYDSNKILLDDEDYCKFMLYDCYINTKYERDLQVLFLDPFKEIEYKLGKIEYVPEKTLINLNKFIYDYNGNLTYVHLNYDKLDYRKNNLKLTTRGQRISYYLAKSENRYIGVLKRRGRYVAMLQYNRRASKIISSHTTAEEAAKVHDIKAIELWGEYALTNFPRENYSSEIEEMNKISIAEHNKNIKVDEEDKYLVENYKWFSSKNGDLYGFIDNKVWLLRDYIWKVLMKKYLPIYGGGTFNLNNRRNDNRRKNICAIVTNNSDNKTSSYVSELSPTSNGYITGYRYKAAMPAREFNAIPAYYVEKSHAMWQINLWIERAGINNANILTKYKKYDIHEEPEGFKEYCLNNKYSIPPGIFKIGKNRWKIITKETNTIEIFTNLQKARCRIDELKKNNVEYYLEANHFISSRSNS